MKECISNLVQARSMPKWASLTYEVILSANSLKILITHPTFKTVISPQKIFNFQSAPINLYV